MITHSSHSFLQRFLRFVILSNKNNLGLYFLHSFVPRFDLNIHYPKLIQYLVALQIDFPLFLIFPVEFPLSLLFLVPPLCHFPTSLVPPLFPVLLLCYFSASLVLHAPVLFSPALLLLFFFFHFLHFAHILFPFFNSIF